MTGSTPTTGDRPIVVMKFGGTSVASPEGRAAVALHVTAALEIGQAPVVVVSAMGRDGDPYATDTLLALVRGLPADPREHDLLASVGEIISAVLVAHELRAHGVDAVALTGGEAGIVTDGLHGSARITAIHTDRLRTLIGQGRVPVVCGFQGVASDGTLTTLGRGGSDTTACALGVALGAEEVHIYTDVDGVMTTDPRVCESARTLEVIRPDELFQMARAGSRVVHTPAAELALTSGLSVRVKNTHSTHPGTHVTDIAALRPDSVATAVTHTDGVVRVVVDLGAEEGTQRHMAAQSDLFRKLADTGASLDMFTPIRDTLVFTVDHTALDAVRGVLDELPWTYDITVGLAKVTVVGAGMHGVPGVMARVAEHLREAGVAVLQIADSHTTISVLIKADQALDAVNALHTGFDLAGSDSLPRGED